MATDYPEPEVLLGGPAIHAFVKKLTGEDTLTRSRFYQRVAAGVYPVRRAGGHLVSTPRELRARLIGAADTQG
jgi:hypothetical protein